MGTLRGILIGAAGFSYPDWIGPVFPRGAASGPRALSALSRWLDLLEVNVSHYRIPEPTLAESWLASTRARPEFRFAAKVHRSYTHGPPAPTVAEHRAMREFLTALAADGRLASILAQFPPSFLPSDRTIAYVRRLVDHFSGIGPARTRDARGIAARGVSGPDAGSERPDASAPPRLAFEFRHASWDRDDVRAALEEDGAAFVLADLLPGPHAIPLRPPSAGAPLAYVRLHGRNAAWYQPGVGRDRRYDYLYGREELSAWAERIRVLRERAEAVVVVANNHFGGQAVANALELKSLLVGGLVTGPASIVAAFPRLKDVVAAEPAAQAAPEGPMDPSEGGWFNPSP